MGRKRKESQAELSARVGGFRDGVTVGKNLSIVILRKEIERLEGLKEFKLADLKNCDPKSPDSMCRIQDDLERIRSFGDQQEGLRAMIARIEESKDEKQI